MPSLESKNRNSIMNPALDFEAFKEAIQENAFVYTVSNPEASVTKVNFLDGRVELYNHHFEKEVVRLSQRKAMIFGSLLVAYNYNFRAIYGLRNLQGMVNIISNHILGCKPVNYDNLRVQMHSVMRNDKINHTVSREKPDENFQAVGYQLKTLSQLRTDILKENERQYIEERKKNSFDGPGYTFAKQED